MSVERLPSGKYRYKFMWKGTRYSGGTYSTKTLAQQTESLHRRELQEIQSGVRTPNSGDRTFFELIRVFSEKQKNHWAEPTAGYYRVHFSNMVKRMKSDFPIANRIDTEQCFHCYINIRLKEVSKATVNKEIQTLMTLFKFARDDQEWIAYQPKLKKFKTTKKQIDILTDNDLQTLLELASLEIGGFILFMCWTGLRDRKSTRLNSSHIPLSRMPSSA